MTLTIFFNELKRYFYSPVAYVISAVFSITVGWMFFNSIIQYIAQIQAIGPGGEGQISFDNIIFSLFGNVNFLLLFIIPLLTMGLISTEKKYKSIFVLYSAPIDDWEIILGKYFAAVFVALFMICLTFIFPVILHFAGLSDKSFFFSGYLALFFNILLYTSLGVLGSCLSENQMVSGLISFAMIMATWMLSWVTQITANYYFVELFHYIGLSLHFESVAKGILNYSDLAYYFSGTFFALLVSRKILNARNW
ncbi:MAG: hypothetical protein JNM93_02310 [Bacteriovoracaceae bacterium]|nr:hypothetical protein [Bacteriovoracaceae bacterium]